MNTHKTTMEKEKQKEEEAEAEQETVAAATTYSSYSIWLRESNFFGFFRLLFYLSATSLVLSRIQI